MVKLTLSIDFVNLIKDEKPTAYLCLQDRVYEQVSYCLQEQAARVAQAELEMRMTEAKVKEEEARRLQQELQHARIQMEENQKALQEVMNAHRHADDDDSEQSSLLN